MKKNGVEPPQSSIKKTEPEVIVIDDADDRRKNDERYGRSRQSSKRKRKSHDKQKVSGLITMFILINSSVQTCKFSHRKNPSLTVIATTC